MSATEQKTGFRLPWGGTRPGDTEAEPGSTAEAPDATAAEPADDLEAPPAPEADASSSGSEPKPEPAVQASPAAPEPEPRATRVSPAPPGRRTNALVTGLIHAMRSAALTARDETLARSTSDATTRVETIRASATKEAAALRQHADEDVAGIRTEAKERIARIREETEQWIADRRTQLAAEIETHAAGIEGRVGRVESSVAEFEAAMADLFERLLVEEDPAKLAGLAEQLPDPPTFDDLDDAPTGSVTATVAAPVTKAPIASPAASPGEAEPPPAEPAPTAPAAEAPAERLAGADAALAEREVLADPELDTEIEFPDIEDRVLAGRLASLRSAPGPADVQSRVVVFGLGSVASIAAFKRSIARLPEVRSVSVTSGPDGEFVFSVSHGPQADLAAAIPVAADFKADVTTNEDGSLRVTVTDPEPAG